MKEKLQSYLLCPTCAAAVKVIGTHREGDEIITGTIRCSGCGKSWPIVRGVPRFAAINEVAPDKATTAEKFGWQWQHFTQVESGHEKQFLAWIAPVTQEFFKDKVVLERRGAHPSRVTFFYNDYLKAIARFGWREQHTIVFDHLIAPTAFYISGDEFADW